MDELTGLPNRVDLPEALKMTQRPNSASGLPAIFFDIDRLQWINCEWGWQKGDAALVSVSGFLRSKAAQANATVFRVGGDEFLFLLPYTSPDDAARLARDVLVECEHLRIPYSRPDDSRDFLALNAVVFTAPPGFEKEIRQMCDQCATVIYETKRATKQTYSVVAVRDTINPPGN